MRSILAVIGISLCALALAAYSASARTDRLDADLCRQAAAAAAEQTGVPYDVLLAISLVETGRQGETWPWTVNIGGEGHWSDTAEDSADLVRAALQSGLTNVDLGCFQLNLHWHASAFQSVEDMLNPERNALYAAEFLAEKFAEKGDWSLAAAAYHSADPDHAKRYQAQFDLALAGLAGAPDDLPSPPELRLNRFPLLVAGTGGSPGSLVPETAGGLRLIGAP